MFFDTHAHYNSPRFDTDRDELLAQLPRQGVRRIINAGYDIPTSRMAAKIAERYGHAYAAAGIHPHDSGTITPDSFTELRKIITQPKVVAVGETGLDYFRNLSHKIVQQDVFRKHMVLARETGLPVIVHNRDAHRDCFEIVSEFPDVKTVFHCYSGSAEMARELTKRGHYISFATNITYPKAADSKCAALAAGLKHIMIETDCPYLPPVTHRGKRNESPLIYMAAGQLAEWFGVSVEYIAEITANNAGEFFGV
jgi:TatD DNase family protein